MLPQPAFDPQFKTIANVQHDDIDQMRPFLGGMAMQPHKVVIQRPVSRRLHLAQVVDADAVLFHHGQTTQDTEVFRPLRPTSQIIFHREQMLPGIALIAKAHGITTGEPAHRPGDIQRSLIRLPTVPLKP